MHYSRIDAVESAILQYGLLGYNISPVTGVLRFDFLRIRPQGDQTYYYGERTEKTAIVLHFTVGNLRGDITQLTGSTAVSTSYVIARNGTIYELFHPNFWSYHLGPNAVGGNTVQSKRAIGIEISNYGPLRRIGDDLVTAYHTEKARNVYCTVQDTEQYVKMEWRGYEYWATYTREQMFAIIDLLLGLTYHFDIPRRFLPERLRYETTSDAASWNGILSHANYRKDKYDIGPAFDWDCIIDMVK